MKQNLCHIHFFFKVTGTLIFERKACKRLKVKFSAFPET